jgi:hypothetical protein
MTNSGPFLAFRPSKDHHRANVADHADGLAATGQ